MKEDVKELSNLYGKLDIILSNYMYIQFTGKVKFGNIKDFSLHDEINKDFFNIIKESAKNYIEEKIKLLEEKITNKTETK